jgi:hypothetical protein
MAPGRSRKSQPSRKRDIWVALAGVLFGQVGLSPELVSTCKSLLQVLVG